jgi:drug/metabolite transporter (DMT)-like permease
MFLALGIIWGIPYFFIKVAVEDLSPSTIVFARTFIAVVVLIPIAAYRRELAPALRMWRWILVFAAIEMMAAWWLLIDAQRTVASSLAGVMLASVPLFGTLIARFRGDRSVTQLGRVIGLALGLVGVSALLGFDLTAGYADTRSVVQLLLVALCYAVAPAISAQHLTSVPGIGLSAISISMTCVVFAIPAALSAPTEMPKISSILSVIGLGLICTALAFILFFALVAEIGPVRLTLITYINPAVAVLLGVLILSEPITLGTIIGFPLVLLGSWLAARPSTRANANVARLDVEVAPS